jgi:prolyl oligopeptidase
MPLPQKPLPLRKPFTSVMALITAIGATMFLTHPAHAAPKPKANQTMTSPAPAIRYQAKAVASNPATLAPDAADPRQYLEEVEGEAALTWVRAQNEVALTRLGKDPRFEELRTKALAILTAKDRIAAPSFVKGGKIENFWQDSEHVRGIWRQTDWESYAAGEPKWETILDIDALAKTEGKNWVYKGKSCLPPEETRCLIMLSDGGKDAVTVREFDRITRTFVDGGFVLPEGKQSASWVDKDTLYVSREWVKGEVTTSGYAYVTKALKRGQSLEAAVEVYRGEASDVSAGRYVLRDVTGAAVMDMSYRSPSFFERTYGFYTGTTAVYLPLPRTSSLDAYYEGQSVWLLKDPFTSKKGTLYPAGTLIAFDLKAALADPANIEPTLLLKPDASQSIEGTTQTRNRLLISMLNNVTGEVRVMDYRDGKWTSSHLDLPANSNLTLGSTDDESDSLFAYATGFVQPTTLYRADAATGKVTRIKATPDRFDATGLKVEQLWATSKDGTKVPYFVVSKAGLKADGSTPTLLYAYGGFEVSMLPTYSGSTGKLWLERGGAYVLANIRGGGEFGPKWHEAGLKTKRQAIFDDFQAVAEDLIARKVTSPRRLGIMGGSNGGLLMGVQFTQRPDLWNAVVIQVPLLDMLRFNQLLAGASWMGEYGDPKVPEEAAFLRATSPYHNLKAGESYPEALIETSTKDDRVHPGHARKFAHLLQEAGLPVIYYENIDGGHSAAANLNETARRLAIEFTYLSQKLMD